MMSATLYPTSQQISLSLGTVNFKFHADHRNNISFLHKFWWNNKLKQQLKVIILDEKIYFKDDEMKT